MKVNESKSPNNRPPPVVYLSNVFVSLVYLFYIMLYYFPLNVYILFSIVNFLYCVIFDVSATLWMKKSGIKVKYYTKD